MVAVPCSNTTSLCACQSPLNCTASSLVLKDQATMNRPWEFIERDEARMAGAAPGDLRLLAKAYTTWSYGTFSFYELHSR